MPTLTAWVSANMTVVAMGLAVISCFVLIFGFRYRNRLGNMLDAIVRFIWYWVSLIIPFTAGLMAAVFGSAIEGVEPWLRWTFVGLALFTGGKDLLERLSLEERRREGDIRAILHQLSTTLSRDPVKVRANFMGLVGDRLAVKVTTSHSKSHLTWEIGQGVCGVAYEAEEIKIAPLETIADSHSFEDIMDVVHGGTPWRINRAQWEATKSLRSVLSNPVHNPSGRLVGVINIDSTASIEDTGFDRKETERYVQFTALAIGRILTNSS